MADKRRYKLRDSRMEKPLGFDKHDRTGNPLSDGYTIRHAEPLERRRFQRGRDQGFAGNEVMTESEAEYGSGPFSIYGED